MNTTSRRTIGILLFDDMEELDAIGPWEVFAWWTDHFPADGFTVTTFSTTGGEVTCAKGLVVRAHRRVDDVSGLDVLVHPGGGGTRRLAHDKRHLSWLRDQRRSASLMASVCTGAIVYAAAGLLRGRPATTYHDDFDRLRGIDPTITVRPGERFVDDGDVITSAGISAGIDMALHIVGRLAGPRRARQVREGIEYDPAPPL
ncbi:MAG: DJ-1/PfpI family protein [Kutzneria sp.]|nr:DJ-1/PfpI family protein [Kutzneria sp.]MBV9847224.1 DJ-1/PfpI family protein [Kutzneria sp.]